MSILYTRIVRLVSNVNIKKADGRIEGRGLRPRDNIRLRRTAPLRLRLGFRASRVSKRCTDRPKRL